MSVSSSNTTVTTESPYLESDLTSSTLGMPAMARSTGAVTYCSTSTGDSAGAAVMIWTCTLVTSGTASIGRLKMARTPTAMKRSVATRTTARWRSDQATTRVRKITSFLLAEGALQDGALQSEHAVGDDQLALAQAGQGLDPVPGGPSQRDRMHLEISVGLQDEHHVLVRDARDGGAGDDHVARGGRGLAGHDPRGAEETDLEQLVMVLHRHPRRHRARGGVELLADGF